MDSLKKIKNYIKAYWAHEKAINPYFDNIKFPKWYMYVYLFFFAVFIFFGLTILYQVFFLSSNIISLLVPFTQVFVISIMAFAIITLIFVTYQSLKNAILDSKYPIELDTMTIKNGKNKSKFIVLDDLIKSKRNILIIRAIISILLCFLFLLFFDVSISMILLLPLLLSFFIIFDYLQYKKYLNMKNITSIDN